MSDPITDKALGNRVILERLSVGIQTLEAAHETLLKERDRLWVLYDESEKLDKGPGNPNHAGNLRDDFATSLNHRINLLKHVLEGFERLVNSNF
jgi:hypothetical protein